MHRQYTLISKKVFGYRVEEGINKKFGPQWGKGYVHIKDWSKPILALFLT
jgi:hypothetical protein